MSERSSYLATIETARHAELAPGEHYLAAVRASMPRPPRRADASERALSMAELRRLSRISLLTREEPQVIPGFPTAWDMVLALTPERLVAWRAQRGTDLPGTLLGAVRRRDLEAVELATLPGRRGRSLAIKFVLRNGPRVLLDVVAGFRADAEAMVEAFADAAST